MAVTLETTRLPIPIAADAIYLLDRCLEPYPKELAELLPGAPEVTAGDNDSSD